MTTQNDSEHLIQEIRTDKLNGRLESIGWSLFLILVGVIWLIPAEQEPTGGWLIGIGLIMLVLNAARLMKGVQLSGFTTLLGIGALTVGIIEHSGTDLEFIPILLILIGASVILKPLVEKNK